MLTGFRLLSTVFLGAAVLSETWAQTARCSNPAFEWSFNSLHQDPCTVGIDLGQICIPTWNIPPASVGQFYSGPTAPGSTTDLECACNTVYFSLLTVCGACQGADTVTWDRFRTNCSQTFESQFPASLPSGVAIPHWAFTPLLPNGTINVAAIEADTQPDVVAGTSSTVSSSATPTPSSPVTSQIPAPTQSEAAANGGGGGGGNNAGAIAGGVIGGVVGLGLLVALAFFLRRYLAKKRDSNEVEAGRAQMSIVPPGFNSPEPASTIRDTSYYADNSFASNRDSPKLYNPDDPATFPPPVSPTILRSASPGRPTLNSSYSGSGFPFTTPSEHGEWQPYRPQSMSPEI